MTTDRALGNLQSIWAQSDAGWSLDSPLGRLWVSCLASADDILVFARSERALTQVIGECCIEFGKIGLEVALDKKTFWTALRDPSVDTAAKVRNTVNTKRMVFSVAGPQSSQTCRCPCLNA